MNIVEFEGKRPVVHPEAFVASTATLIGDVTVEAGASVWYGAVLRGDICTIVVREGSNIQDNSVLHAAPGEVLTVGPDATVGHSCVVHGRTVEERALVGNASTLLDGSVIGPGTLVGAGSVVTPGTEIPGGMLATGIPCKPLKPIAGTSSQPWIDSNAEYYRDLGQRHHRAAREVEQ